jgi:hypothetical protein
MRWVRRTSGLLALNDFKGQLRETFFFDSKVRAESKLFHRNSGNLLEEISAYEDDGGRNVVSHLPTGYMEGVPGDQNIALLCGEPF